MDQEVKMDMTPMIDVTFQLLIFFIITMKFRTLEKKLNSYLPTDFGLNTSSAPVEENFITVKIRQKKASEDPRPIRERSSYYYVETEEIKGATEKEIFQKIYKRIKAFRDQNKDAKGKIDAGTGVPHYRVVSVLDLFHKSGFETITFVGLTVNKDISAGMKWWRKMRETLGDM